MMRDGFFEWVEDWRKRELAVIALARQLAEASCAFGALANPLAMVELGDQIAKLERALAHLDALPEEP